MTKFRRMLMAQNHAPKVYEEILLGHVSRTLFVVQGLACDNNFFYVTNSDTPSILKLDRADLSNKGNTTYTSAQIGNANCAVLDGNGNLWVTQATSSTAVGGMALIDTSDMSWVSETGQLVDKDGNYVSPYVVAYNPSNGHFYSVYLSNAYEWDSNWNAVRSFTFSNTDMPANSTAQGAACDGQYIYTLRGRVGGDTTKNIIRIHDLNGNYIGTINCLQEYQVSDLAYDAVNNKMYLVYYRGTRNNGFDIYELKNYRP